MSRFEALLSLCALNLLVSFACYSQEHTDTSFSYPDSYDLGKTVSQAAREQLLTTIPPDGVGLPEGSGTFEMGRGIYETKCMACHGNELQGTDTGMPLIGGRGTLATNAPKKTVESYWPYATSVFSYIRNAMPISVPGSLTNVEVYSLMAYLLGSAGIIHTDVVMNKHTLADVRMPNRDGFVRDDRPDVAAPEFAD